MDIQNVLREMAEINRASVDWSQSEGRDYYRIARPICLGHIGVIDFILRSALGNQFMVEIEDQSVNTMITIYRVLDFKQPSERRVAIFRFMNHHCAPNDEDQIMKVMRDLKELTKKRIVPTA